MISTNNDNRKKQSENKDVFNAGYENGLSLKGMEFGGEEHDMFATGMDAMKSRTAEKLNYLTAPANTKQQELAFRNSFADYMLPKDSQERHRRNYALSREALDDVVGDYYNNSLKRRFEMKREDAKRDGRNEYMRYTSVPGADPVNAYKASVRVDDPERVIDETMKSVDDDYLMKQVAPLASYGGYDAKEYVDNLVKPSLRDKMVKEYIDENTPRSSAEYVMRSAFDNSLMGKVGALGLAGDKSAKSNRLLASEGVANYDANRMENFAAGVGGLLVDTPAFSGFGRVSASIVGNGTRKAVEKISRNVLSRYKDRLVSKEFADGVARKVVVERLKNRIVQGATAQGLTLGGYDVANSVADDILYNGTVDPVKATGSFVKGFATGAAVGAVGTSMRARVNGLTSGKRLLSSAGVLSAESAVFTAGSELDKLAHGVEVEPIDLLYDYAESSATLLTMRMANWRPKGAAEKLDKEGHIKEELKLSKSQAQELREANVNPEEFMEMIEHELRIPSLSSSGARLLKENYAKLMADKNLSAASKSKLMYLVENKITSTPPVVFDYEVSQNEHGIWLVKMLDAGGGVVENLSFDNAGAAKSHLIKERAGIRRNRIAHFENELTSGINSYNFLHEAGLYAKEKGVSADILAEAMYKSARKEQLNSTEQFMIDEILARSSYHESQISSALSNARRNIEENYKLDRGALSAIVDKHYSNCTFTENMALDEYENFVRSEVERIKERASVPHPAAVLGMSNAEIKRREAEEYNQRLNNRLAVSDDAVTKQDAVFEKLRVIPENRPGHVWNVYGHELKKETVDEYERHAREFSSKFGQDIVFITDEHQIERPAVETPDAVREYNNRLHALGWVHKGKVYINLPNIKDHAELETTIVHEVVGHLGLKKLFGRYMYDFIEDVYKSADGSVRHGINKIRDAYGKTDMYTATEEYLASLVEKAYPNAQERNLLVRFKDFVKGMLIRHNIYKPKYRRVNEKDLQSIMEAHCRYVFNNRDASKHRGEVFGKFRSATLDAEAYSNPDDYARRKRDMIQEGSYMKWTPEKFKGAKYLVNYPYLPANIQERIMKETGMSDEALRMQSEAANYRFEGKKGAKNYGKAYYEDMEEVLEDAVSFEKDGLSPLQIKKLTGWERGADGEWRREVSEYPRLVRDYIYASLFDNKPELAELYKKIKKVPYEAWGDTEKDAWERVMKEGKRYMKRPVLQDVVNDFELFISYPEFAAIPVRIVEDAPSLVRYDSKDKEMVVDRKLFLSPEANGYMAAALQNVIQEYEGFSKAVSLRLLSLEGRLAKKYKNAQKCIALVDGVRRELPSFDENSQIERAFEREFGMDIQTFKRMYPTYDDYLFHKLTGKNFSFSGNVEMENVRKRYKMNEKARNSTLAEETESVPRDRQVVVKRLEDLEKYFTGPLDVINRYVHDIHSDEPMKVRSLGGRFDKTKVMPAEFAEFDSELDSYTKYLLRNMVKERSETGDSYGYRMYKDLKELGKKDIKKKLDNYAKGRGWFWNMSDDDLNILN